VIQEVVVLLETDHHVLTLVGSKQESSQAENTHKRSQEFLRSMLFDRRIIKRWSDMLLPLVQRFKMAESNEVTGVSPAELLFGNMIQLVDRGISCHNLQNLSMLK
jgi:hypothetical protein